jgi:KaiC/GvpD/RAD55 family RecA-like ATPase
MTGDDVRQRLEGFGYGPDDDYSRFNYVLAMSFGSDLDTDTGGAELLAYALDCGADLVVVDTMSRAVAGNENEADTVRRFYKHTGGLLKAHGIAVLRLDHAGKSADKGQRGSSGKNDDVDVVWRLERKDQGSELTCTHKRMAWVPEKVQIRHDEDEDGRIRLRRADGGELWPAGVVEKAAEMDAAGVPFDCTTRQIREFGIKGKDHVLRATIRYRREMSERSISEFQP